jgi:CRP/FNR family transcriptional regulator, cyclic AMP receptor protein
VAEEVSSILIEDTELGEHLSEARLGHAKRDCVARVIRLGPGPWTAGAEVRRMRFGIGLLVLDGLLIRRVGLESRFGAELLGAGDLLRPWQSEEGQMLPHTGGWRVLRDTRLAVLDSAFALRTARYPEIISALFGRAIRRSRHLAINMAIVHQPRVDLRLHMLFCELADRWGSVHPDGVRLPIRLTHVVLGELIAARRPSVTKALAELAERKAVCWTGDAWLLQGAPPIELGDVRALSRPGRTSDPVRSA